MTGRGRTRRHGSTGSNPFSLSASKLIRLGMMVVLMSSALYLFCTHTLVSREPSNGPSGDGSLRFNPSNPNTGGAIHRPGDPNLHYDSQVAYEEDPRNPGGGRRSEVEGAQSRMDYVELRCEGGKKPDVDLSYWKDIPADKAFESPWGASARKSRDDGLPRYVTFEPDRGGFNNIRMAMETVLVFAKQTGRTLVMPPAQKFYLLNRPAVEFADMFPIEYLSDYMEVISMEEFLKREGVPGRLGRKPPDNKSSGHTKQALERYLRSVADMVPQWNHMEQAMIFGPSPDSPSIPTDSHSQAWHAAFLTEKRRPLEYTDEMQRARLIHFRTSGLPTGEEYRLFTHFYTFLGFVDPATSRHHRRLVRDVVHFRESLFCAAATITARLRTAGSGHPGRWSGWYGEWGGLREEEGRDRAGGGGEGGPGEEEGGVGALRRAGFSTFHIRRGDFQYVRMKPPATTILNATTGVVKPGEVLYIATDERDKSFFDPFRDDHRLFFLDDFQDVLAGIDPSYYLMLDTIVAAQGRSFIGTWRSTFTGYITRLRGYYRYPTEFSWYYWDESKMDYRLVSLNADTVPRSPFFMREWPNAWEEIDQDIWPQ